MTVSWVGRNWISIFKRKWNISLRKERSCQWRIKAQWGEKPCLLLPTICIPGGNILYLLKWFSLKKKKKKNNQRQKLDITRTDKKRFITRHLCVIYFQGLLYSEDHNSVRFNIGVTYQGQYGALSKDLDTYNTFKKCRKIFWDDFLLH